MPNTLQDFLEAADGAGNLLDRRRVDPDLADEYVREKLGVMHPDEIAIPVEPEAKP